MGTFAKAIKEARRKKGITLRELSGWTKMPASMLSEMERGKRQATQKKEQIQALSKILDIDFDRLNRLAKEERQVYSSNLSKRFFQASPELALSFCRAVDEMAENELEEFMSVVLKRKK